MEQTGIKSGNKNNDMKKLLFILVFCPFVVKAQVIPSTTSNQIKNIANQLMTTKGKEMIAKQLVVENDSVFLIHYFKLDTTNNIRAYSIPEYIGDKLLFQLFLKGRDHYYVNDSTFFK